MEADGGSRGNPGPAGYGAVVRDGDTGKVLAEVAEPIGRATNNVAEYRGLIAGLRAAAGIDAAAAVEAKLDSKLVVEQMSGRWRIKHPDIIPLASEARDAAAGLAKVRYTWVPRERNTHADRLANEAMDGKPKSQAAQPTAPQALPQPSGWSASDTAPTRLILLRHGQTPLSVERRFAGTGDIELTAAGHEQARAAARRLAGIGIGIDAIVSSPLRRARDTAEHAAKELSAEVEIVPGLTETDFGEWEGRTFAEVRKRWPQELTRWLEDQHTAPPGGESFASADKRVGAAREELLAAHSGKTVLAVSHVTPIKVLLRQALLAPPEALYRMHLDTGSISEIRYFSDGPAVVHSVNDTAHLQ